jgi:hypothetical protein
MSTLIGMKFPDFRLGYVNVTDGLQLAITQSLWCTDVAQVTFC